MCNIIKWSKATSKFKESFEENSKIQYITIDSDGTACGWSEEPHFNDESMSWYGDWCTVIGVMEIPGNYIMEYSEEIYHRSMFADDIKVPTAVKVDNFNAEALRKTSNSFVKDAIHNNIKDAAEKAAASGQYSACCWIGWVPPMQRRVHLAEATAELKGRGFNVHYDEDKEHLCIEW